MVPIKPGFFGCLREVKCQNLKIFTAGGLCHTGMRSEKHFLQAMNNSNKLRKKVTNYKLHTTCLREILILCVNKTQTFI